MIFFWMLVIFGVGGLGALFAGLVGPGLGLLVLAALSGVLLKQAEDY